MFLIQMVITSLRQKKNRPVLLYPDGSVIGQKDLIKGFGFQAITLYRNALKINASRVEDFLQTRYNHLPLGMRLWRDIAKVSKYGEKENQEFKCFLTFAFNLPLGDTIVVWK
mmetsp:Transcript_3033/g.3448  ORF Transcript_3033/g.3448 Transcript_3033/m.3448 type:complete len:112 (-) Transcript_3033:173-508(-)